MSKKTMLGSLNFWETSSGDLVNLDSLMGKLSRAERTAVEDMIRTISKMREKRDE